MNFASRACARLLLALALCAGATALRAQDVYKSVDAQGRVTFSDRPPADADQSTVAVDDALPPPRVLHFCWSNCFTLKAKNGIYVRTDGTAENWTIERFTPRVFVLRRHDAPAVWNGYRAEVKYAGRIANEQLTEVTIDGQPVSDIQMSWGSALNVLPANNAERDRLAARGLYPPSAESPPSGEAPPQGEAAPDGAGPAGDGAAPGEGAAPQITTSEVPPPLPEEEQPECTVVGGIWVPGYWAWAATGYYWVRGAWALPPRAGVLWTPGYWVLVGGGYVFHRGYWVPHVGYYGGINYGYGYFGAGYSGGHWVGTRFFYNAAVSHVNTRIIRDTYREAVRADLASSRLSYHSAPASTTVFHVPNDHAVPEGAPAAPAGRTAQGATYRTADGASESTAEGSAGRTRHRGADRRSRLTADAQGRTLSPDVRSGEISRPKAEKPRPARRTSPTREHSRQLEK